MGRDSSIVYKGLDQFTGPVNSMKNANQGFSKELEETGRKLLEVIAHNRGGANKDLGRFADQLRALIEKWDR